MKYEARGDYDNRRSSICNSLRPSAESEQLTGNEEIQALYPSFKGNINLLSDDPNGTVEAGLPPGQVRAGVVEVGDMTADVILVRVDDPVASGKIWLISQETVAASCRSSTPKLKAEPLTSIDLRLAVQSGRQLLGMSSAQWLWLAALDPDLVATRLAVELFC